MKLRVLMLAIYAVLAIFTVLFAKKEGQKPKADMYLPIKLLAMALALLAGAVLAALYGVSKGQAAYGYAACALLTVFAVCAFLCWKNQKIRILSQEEFEYTTFLGNAVTYRFDDIEGLKRNKDSMTLLLKSGKVHIESMAVLSPELVEKINAILQPPVAAE